MKKQLIGVFVAFFASLILMVEAPVKANDPMKRAPAKGHGAAPPTMSQIELRNAMRMLGVGHVVCTRDFISRSLAGIEDAGPVAERLLRNQADIGAAIKPICGEAAGDNQQPRIAMGGER